MAGKPKFKVLSIAGGGIRGIIPAIVLCEIEKRAKNRAAKLFDLIAGTSTGGILALGITKPHPGKPEPEFSAKDLVNLYENEGESIFPGSLFNELRGWICTKYGCAGIEKVLNKYFQDTYLSKSITDVFITSYETETRKPFFFDSKKAKKDIEYDFFMKDVARSTSAAPTYFSPAYIKTASTLGHYTLLDGGLYANNPAMCAYVEALKRFPENDMDITLVSLGTGIMHHTLFYDKIKSYGKLGWARLIMDVVSDGINETVDYQLKKILPENFYSFQVNLSDASESMDDASVNNIQKLKVMAQELIYKEDKKLDSLIDILNS
ncbi:MAG: patatin [Candidatus Margulisiibacteriota bacterium]|nr:MAG: hypothetical protein A2X42_09835 [Candidatus Margulisbacteria bacterium GWF2_38_17]OGI10721.1 MAG: hypothetical protein A2X41_06350 [Candidatus Margulisbacteria bacterium GWE2_39_32]PZM83980.1 MAG: patatin [Candidatus Margulisiibacteriota bacterium]HCT83881.1 patatin [Candidatus Margulisiibacteriota bacterium]HCY37264.1 patatin [Candidatus Margulisiibacteriota bacterium]